MAPHQLIAWVKTGKISMGFGFEEELEQGGISFAQAAFIKQLLDGKTAGEAVAASPQKICAFYGGGLTSSSTLKDLK